MISFEFHNNCERIDQSESVILSSKFYCVGLWGFVGFWFFVSSAAVDHSRGTCLLLSHEITASMPPVSSSEVCKIKTLLIAKHSWLQFKARIDLFKNSN